MIDHKSFESTFPSDYRQADIEQVLRFVLAGKFCQLICLPGGGKATVLKLLAHNENVQKFHLGEKASFIRFVYLNLLELPNLNQPTIDKFLLLSIDPTSQIPNDPILLSQQLKNTVHELITHQPSTIIVLLFDHFDEFQNKLDRQFFQTLRTLRSLAKYKFAVVFAARRDLRELVDPELKREFYDFFVENSVYMKLYDEAAVDFMLSQIEKLVGKKMEQEQKKKLTELTGGHTKLTKVCTESLLNENTDVEVQSLLNKPLIRATLFELWLFLTAEEQQALVNLPSSKPAEQTEVLENLINFGLLKPREAGFTIPLFAEFVKDRAKTAPVEKITFDPQTREIKKGQTIVSDLLSPQEYRLLKFLIENEGRVVEREKIVSAVWPDIKSVEGISEAAIDQMVHRLRKKIEDWPNNPKHILTIKGRGFRFAP